MSGEMTILLWAIGAGFSINFALFLLVWNMCSRHFEKQENRFEKQENRFDAEMREIRTSLNRMEGAFYSKECCILKNDTKGQEKAI